MKNDNSKNLKLYPKYRQLSMDFLFYYTINVLFLTQIKKFDMSSVVLVDTFYALFVVALQVPSTLIVGKFGRKKGMILGNLCNALYLLLFINSTNLMSLIFAECACALGFSLKDIAEPAMLNDSIKEKSETKSNIFAKIQSKAVSGYYILSALSMILSGFLYKINGYIPIYLSLGIVIITLILSTFFEDVEENEEKTVEDEGVSLIDTIKFSFIDSKRCRCLLIFSAIFYAVVAVLATYEISLLEELNISPEIIGIIFAFLNVISSLSSKMQDKFQAIFKNRTLSVLGIMLTFSCLASGCISKLNINIYVMLFIIILMYMIKYMMVGLYNVLLIKYLSNFTNKLIDTKIFGLNSFFSSVTSALFGIIASYLVDKYSIGNSMIIFGTMSFALTLIVLAYMRDKVGLDPKKYSKKELQYENKV